MIEQSFSLKTASSGEVLFQLCFTFFSDVMEMASSSSDMADNLDALTCSVCLKIYKDPVTLPCGHSFCRVCIEKCWESREEDCDCPNCREVFPQKTKLKKNVTIAYLVENIVNVKKGVRCTQHGKPIQLYCKDDESLMCLMCTGGEHQNHNVVAVEIAHSELKVSSRFFTSVVYSVQSVLAAKYSHVSQSMESVASQLQQVQEEKEQTENFSRDAEDRLEEKGKLVCKFVNESVDLLKREINKKKMEKLSLLGKQREKLKQQMEDLHQGKSTMDTAFQKLEAVSFLQDSKDLLKRLETMSVFKSVKKTPLPVLDFSKQEKNLDGLIMLNKNFLEKIQKEPVEHPEKVEEAPVEHPEKVEEAPVEHLEKVELDQNNLKRLYGRSPSLDPNSAHRRIKISGDLRTATGTRTENQYPEHPDRFDYWEQVVSCDCFSSGRHYWEVHVRSSRLCRIGICLNSMGRKGGESGLGMNPESWCLFKCDDEFFAHHNKQRTSLSVPGDHERFGFFLDCEAGELTCFVDSRVLHVFRRNFKDPVRPAIWVYDDDGSVHFVNFVK
uniref:E3 ubiquitin-protein ligase TRIM39-like n=1 Tax=Myxine glutinosa TaxID=7769 RepID=UPI00358FFE18